MVASTVSYEVDTEVPPSYINKLMEFIYKEYLMPQKQRFSGISKKTSNQNVVLSYFIIDDEGREILDVEISGETKVNVKIMPKVADLPENTIENARQDVVIAIRMFEEKARKATWYFAWREGEKIVPEKVKIKEKSFNRFFLETQVLLFISFIVVGMGLFIGISILYPSWLWIAPIILIAVQFVFVFYSSKFISRTADWTITKENPIIHFLEYRFPLGALESLDEFKQTAPERLAAIKQEVYDDILTKQGYIDCKAANKVFSKYDISCREDSLFAKKINVYDLVKKVADKFGYPVPKIVISNTMVPNAAASGPSPSRGIVLITTGLLVTLDIDEVEGVLGHEFGHLKGRDPLILYGLTSAEFLFRFYVLFALVPVIFTSFLFLAYFWAVMTVIFFIAKFFEARADIISAIKIGKPKILARALEKIGFQRLLFERTSSFRLQEWIGLDSHPPIYFRVNRLYNLDEPINVKHPLIQSMKEVFQGLFSSF